MTSLAPTETAEYGAAHRAQAWEYHITDESTASGT
jgi:hypothetical protein